MSQQPYYPYPPQQPQRPPEQLIKTYSTNLFGYAQGRFVKDAAKLAKQGWRVQSQSSSNVHPLTRKVISITVVYVR